MTKQKKQSEKAAVTAPKAPKAAKATKQEAKAADAPVSPAPAPEAALPKPVLEGHPLQAAAEKIFAAHPDLFNGLTDAQILFIANKVQAAPDSAAVTAMYKDSTVVSRFARLLSAATKAPAPDKGEMVFCDSCGRSVPKADTEPLGDKRYCKDLNGCKAAKADPKAQTQAIADKKAAEAAKKTEKAAAKATKAATSGRSWPWPDTSVILVVNPNHGRTGVRADIFGKICQPQTIAELKVKTFSQRGADHKIPVCDVQAAVAKGNIKIFKTTDEAASYIAGVTEADAKQAAQGHQGEAPTAQAEPAEDACIEAGIEARAEAIANA